MSFFKNIGTSIRDFYDRSRVSVSIKSKNVLFFFALVLVFVLALLIRLTPILRGSLMIKAFDPWIQYYSAKYITENGIYEFFNWHDYKSWFPGGIDRYALRPGLPFTAAAFWFILNSIGINVSIYHVCFFFPAFMGGLTVIAAFFLGKEILDRRMGLLAAFFLALNTGHAQRTMAGFFDNETIGVFATLMVFLFFLKAIKTGKISYSILGGLFLGYLSLSWGGYQFVFLIIPIIVVILVLINKYNSNVLIAYAGVQGTGLLIEGLWSVYDYTNLFSDAEVGGIFLFTFILIAFHLIYTKREKYPKFYYGLLNFLKWGIIPVALVLAVIVWINPEIIPFGFGGRIQSILSPLMRENINLTASVAEHIPSPWSVFYYNTLIPLILVPLGIYFAFKRGQPGDILLILFTLLIFYFTGSMIRIILLFAPAASLMGAYGLVNVLKIYGSFVGERKLGLSRKRRRQLRRKKVISNSEVFAVFFLVGFLCLAQVVHATDVSINQLSYSQIVTGGQLHDWEESLAWMKTNLPGTAVVVSWWDYGYWLTPIGNVTTVNDNATINQTRIGLTGMAMMQTNEIYSAEIFRLLGADYVLVYFGFLYPSLGGDEGKWQWMLRICNDNYEIYKRWGLEKDNWAASSVFIESEYYNSSNNRPEDKWFDSTLVKLMFGYESTNPSSVPENSFKQYYANEISNRIADDGRTWAEHIPTNGAYDFKVFKPEYFSLNGLVKLYKVDYTALDSSFIIKNASVYDNEQALLTVENTGIKDLEIEKVEVNNDEFDFITTSQNEENLVKAGEEEIVWVNTSSTENDFKEGDVVDITVTVKAEALDETTYEFSNYTSSFFVEKGEPGAIRINRENCEIRQSSDTEATTYIEVENIGNSVEVIDKVYLNTIDNEFNTTNYLSGSLILRPGEISRIELTGANGSYYDLNKENCVGVLTRSGSRDEIILASNYENYKISIISQDRVLSPEVRAFGNSVYRNNIPISIDSTYAKIYSNGTKEMQVKIKNTGNVILSLNSILVNNTIIPQNKIVPQNGLYQLELNQEEVYSIDTNFIDYSTNDLLSIFATADFDGEYVASDIGYIQPYIEQPNFQIINSTLGEVSSYMGANETGQLLIKNTGNASIILSKIIINDNIELTDNDINYLYGGSTIGFQDAALISFEIPTLQINRSDIIRVNISTENAGYLTQSFEAYINEELYNVTINDIQSYAERSGDLSIYVQNTGIESVNVESIYVENINIPLSEFKQTEFEILSEETYLISIDMDNLVPYIGDIDAGDNLLVLVRTKEGPEDSITINVGT